MASAFTFVPAMPLLAWAQVAASIQALEDAEISGGGL